jgi:ATP-dependent helicase/nuclease subunit B
MGLYYIPPSVHYLSTIAEYLIENSQEDLSSFTIYLPTYKACRYLQEILLNKNKKAIILPRITTLYDIGTSDDGYNNLSQENIFNTADIIEQELVLTDIIREYPRFDYSLAQALALSKNLASLFKEFTLSGIDISALSELYNGDFAEHWLNIQEFLIYAQSKWQAYLHENNKIDCATQQLILLQEKIRFFKENNSQKVIIAGIKPELPLIKELYKIASNSSNIVLVLPTICMELVKSYWDKVHTHANLDYIKFLTEEYKIDLKDIKILKPIQPRYEIREKALFNLFFLSKPSIRLTVEGIQGIKYLPTSNQTEESALIGVIIKYLRDYKPGSRIAIITQNKKLVKQIEVFLKRFGLEFNRNGVRNLTSFKAANFLMLLFQMVESKFSASNCLNFMKHPYFICDNVFELELMIFRGPEILGGHYNILSELQKLQNDKLTFWFEEIIDKVKPLIEICHFEQISFKDALIRLIKVAENLCPNLWKTENIPLIEYLRDLLNVAELLKQIPVEDFQTFLNSLFNQKNVDCSNDWQPKIFAATPDEIGMMSNIDYVILSDLNDESWPKAPSVDPWMGDRMRESLGLEKKSKSIIKDFQNFYNVLHCKEVFLTRALKSEGMQTTASRFLLKFISKLETQNLLKHLESEVDWHSVVKDVLFPDKPMQKIPELYKAKLEHFPKNLAVTYLELLMRNPHAFYAKKILKLVKLDPIGAEAGPKEFGIFLHKVFEEYSNNYNLNDINKFQTLLYIARNVIKEQNINKFTENLWWPKFKNIAKEFIKYDDSRRNLGFEVTTEAQGILEMNIDGNKIFITAKADRLEANDDGIINIIDFKTGGIPTIKDIHAGLSPQLLVEYLILANGGFKNFQNFKEINLSYIKLSSSKPYLKESVVELKLDIKNFTQEGIRKLLQFFLQEEVLYLPCPNKQYAPTYNDYDHLARNE